MRKALTSMPALTSTKSSSMRGWREGKDCSPAVLALRSPAACMNRNISCVPQKVLKSLPGNARGGEQGVGLLAHDGYQLIDRAGAVFALVSRIVTHGIGDVGG